ncbi:uncharacterized protein LOC133189452 [Saccostrea echinata]|uniref:uncharacterized protein LOC133189452 n=1 Tax=Saccostrea echinata TaxID=191078 RepID=UPI002A829202|nr:uncharacterized protein LOC133189452 [Saccostrea echinata]
MSQEKLPPLPFQQNSQANERAMKNKVQNADSQGDKQRTDQPAKNKNDKGKQMESQKDNETTIEKVEGKASCALLILTVGIMVTSIILVTWCVIARKAKLCEKKEALEILNMDSFVSCSYDDAREKIKTILIIGCVSVAVSPLCLLLRLPLSYAPTGKFEIYFFFCLVISVLLFIYTIPILDLKASQKLTDYGTLKKVMFNSLAQKYTSDEITRSNTMSDRWNTFFIKYDCCAVNQIISTTNDFDTAPWCTTSGSCQQTNSQIPKTCCKDITEEDYVNATSSCHATVTAGSYKDSCFARVINLSNESLKEYQIDMIITCSLTLAVIMFASFLHVLVLIFISIFKRSECCTKCCN